MGASMTTTSGPSPEPSNASRNIEEDTMINNEEGKEEVEEVEEFSKQYEQQSKKNERNPTAATNTEHEHSNKKPRPEHGNYSSQLKNKGCVDKDNDMLSPRKTSGCNDSAKFEEESPKKKLKQCQNESPQQPTTTTTVATTNNQFRNQHQISKKQQHLSVASLQVERTVAAAANSTIPATKANLKTGHQDHCYSQFKGRSNKKPLPEKAGDCEFSEEEYEEDKAPTSQTNDSISGAKELKWKEEILLCANPEVISTFYPSPENDQGVVERIAYMCHYNAFQLFDIRQSDHPTTIDHHCEIYTHLIQYDPTNPFRIFVGDFFEGRGRGTCIRVYNDIRSLTKDQQKEEPVQQGRRRHKYPGGMYIPDRIIRLPCDILADFRLTSDGQKLVALVGNGIPTHKVAVFATYDDSTDFIAARVPIEDRNVDNKRCEERPPLLQRNSLKEWNIPEPFATEQIWFSSDSPNHIYTYKKDDMDKDTVTIRFMTWAESHDDNTELPFEEYVIKDGLRRLIVSPIQDKRVFVCHHDRNGGFTLYQDGNMKYSVAGKEGAEERCRDMEEDGAFSRNGMVYAVASYDPDDNRGCIKYYDVNKMLRTKQQQTLKTTEKEKDDHSYLLATQELPAPYEINPTPNLKFIDKYSIAVHTKRYEVRSFHVPTSAVVP